LLGSASVYSAYFEAFVDCCPVFLDCKLGDQGVGGGSTVCLEVGKLYDGEEVGISSTIKPQSRMASLPS
jgi:hypothetical protein